MCLWDNFIVKGFPFKNMFLWFHISAFHPIYEFKPNGSRLFSSTFSLCFNKSICARIWCNIMPKILSPTKAKQCLLLFFWPNIFLDQWEQRYVQTMHICNHILLQYCHSDFSLLILTQSTFLYGSSSCNSRLLFSLFLFLLNILAIIPRGTNIIKWIKFRLLESGGQQWEGITN